MIERSPLVFTSVLMASFGLHLAAMTLISPEPESLVEGGAHVAESSMGSSFADLTAGTLQPVQTIEPALQPTSAEPVKPLEASLVAPSEATAKTAGKPLETADAPAPVKTLSRPVEANMVVAALPDNSSVPNVSVRPKLPTKRPEPKRAVVKKKKVEPAPGTPAKKVAKPRGNAKQNAKAGTQTGTQKKAQTQQASKAATSKAQGNAAVSNYPGQVMRRISRVPRPRTSAKGAAVVQFTIAANGGLASAGIARSSGSAALDQAALAVVRKAQPFPRPPSGARRGYSIKIKGR